MAKKKVVKKAVSSKQKAGKSKPAVNSKPEKKKAVKKVNPLKKKAIKKASPTKRKAGKKASPVKKTSIKKNTPASVKATVGKSVKKTAPKKTVKRAVAAKKKVNKARPSAGKSAKRPETKRGDVIKNELSKVVNMVQNAVQNVTKFAHQVIDKIESNIVVHHDEKPKFVQHLTSLKEGSVAPYFEGVDQNNKLIRSSDLLGQNIILYFYPKDHTDGCTAESCSLRDENTYFIDNNYVVIGVSADDVKSHKRFAEDYMLPFSLIADTDKTIINAFDVWGTKQLAGNIYDGIVRTTFIIDPDGIIKHIISKVDSANAAQQIRSL